MVDKNSQTSICHPGSGALRGAPRATSLLAVMIGLPVLGITTTPLTAQQSTENPAAASGMTTGLPGVSTQRQAELMQVRARAQAARPEAERAAMERSAEDALARSADQQILDDARETRRLKEDAARQIQYQKAANAYQGVSASELNSWSDETGRVKVERGVPPEVLAALPPVDEDLEREEEESGGFNPLKMPKKAARAAGGAAGAAVGLAKKGISWIPGVGKDEDPGTGISASPRSRESAPSYEPAEPTEPESSGGGMFSRLPLVGGMMNRGDEAEPAPAPQAAQVEDAGEKSGFFRGIASSMPFIGGRDEAPAEVEPDASPAQPFVGPVGSAPVLAESSSSGGEFESGSTAIGGGGAAMPSEESDGGGGFFKNLIGRGSSDGAADNSGSLASGSGNIDASLFPQAGDPDELMADKSAGRRKLFQLPKLPDLPQIALPSSQEAPAPETPMPKANRSPVHSGGSAVYVVQGNGAQFMRFAGGPLGSEAQTLSAGTQVKMTKVGDEWSSVQLSNGSTGIVRNKDLKPAAAGSGGASFASQTPATGGLATSSTGTARITSPVSATGAGISDVPGPPVSLPTSSLTGGGLPVVGPVGERSVE